MVTAEQIRKRTSYRWFKELYEYLERRPRPDSVEILKMVHGVIDSYRGFHSQYNSDCAMESIELLEKEIVAGLE